MMRVLLDTNVLVSTAIKPEGKPGQIFRFAAARYDLLCTEAILAELADVLARPHLQKKYKDLVAPARREQFVNLVQALAEMVTVESRLEVVADPDDNLVLAGAIDGSADYLVTGDPHLLEIGEYQRCRIITPDEFLQLLSGEE
jgi:uncharacterized protein